MKHWLSTYRGLLPPILIGFLSIIGITLILFNFYLNAPKSNIPQTATATSFKFLFLATEIDIASPEIPTGSNSTPTDAETRTQSALVDDTTPTLETQTEEQITPQAASATTITVDAKSTFPPGKYDNTDERFIYDGDWTSDFLVPDAFEGSISYSTTTGSAIAFNFTGRQIQIGYLGGSDLGKVLISINGKEYVLDQSAGASWTSPSFPYATYTVIITHQSGEQVLFDYINITGSP